MKFDADIDLDFGNRDQALSLFRHIPASISRASKFTKHNTGVYFQPVPHDPLTGMASIDYQEAERRGYLKIDFLNVSVYQQVRDPDHLTELMNTEPPWDRIYDPEFCAKVIHIGNHYDTLISMPEAVNTIPRMAMFLAIIRPGKRHLIGKPWAEVAKTIWEVPSDGGYFFKQSHSISYSHLVALHMNLLHLSN